VNAAADAAPDTLRLSMDVKATVKVGPFARGGKSRIPTVGADHDFGGVATVAPIGILLPQTGDVFLYTTAGPVTSDCLVDVVTRWWEQVRGSWPTVRRLVLNLDNGPEQNSGRTQFMKRLVEFAAASGLTVELAYYPPYHSKYNPIERCWGVLEQHWNGSILDTVAAVEGFMGSMRWKGRRPVVVERLGQVYKTGVSLTRAAMKVVETQIQRLDGLAKWFVTITPAASLG
jgi:Rhodopirellula transposase DDE domain